MAANAASAISPPAAAVAKTLRDVDLRDLEGQAFHLDYSACNGPILNEKELDATVTRNRRDMHSVDERNRNYYRDFYDEPTIYLRSGGFEIWSRNLECLDKMAAGKPSDGSDKAIPAQIDRACPQTFHSRVELSPVNGNPALMHVHDDPTRHMPWWNYGVLPLDKNAEIKLQGDTLILDYPMSGPRSWGCEGNLRLYLRPVPSS